MSLIINSLRSFRRPQSVEISHGFCPPRKSDFLASPRRNNCESHAEGPCRRGSQRAKARIERDLQLENVTRVVWCRFQLPKKKLSTRCILPIVRRTCTVLVRG